MERGTPQDSEPLVVHNELTIVLGASYFDPAHINPDFLRHNEIVDASWQIDPPVIIESGFSLVEYTNGLELTATNDYLKVSQTARTPESAEIVGPDVVSRYLAVAPWTVEYQYIDMDLSGAIRVAGSGFEAHLSPFNDLSQRVQFGDITPVIEIRAVYRFPDKSLTMYVFEVREENAITSLRFNALIHRDIASDASPEEQKEFIQSTLEKWRQDTLDFNELAGQFYLRYLQEEE